MPKSNQAVAQNVTLYPEQRAIVEAFAQRAGRTFSNALQFIVDDWARIADPDNTLSKSATTAKPSRTRTAPRPRQRPTLARIPALTKGLPKPN